MAAKFELAQLNIGRARGPIDGPVMAGFVANLARINALAEASRGFLWRLQDETGDATSIHPFDDRRIIVNLSVWTSVDRLADYAYRSDHVAVLRQGKDWFVPMDGPHLVLWWVARGTDPAPTRPAAGSRPWRPVVPIATPSRSSSGSRLRPADEPRG